MTRKNYSFIRPGAQVRWNDPEIAEFGEEAREQAARVYTVIAINSDYYPAQTEDDIVLIADDYSEAEVLARELVAA